MVRILVAGVHGTWLLALLMAAAACGGATQLPASAARKAEPQERFELDLDAPWSFVLDPDDVGLGAGWAAALAETGELPDAAIEVQSMPVPGAFEGRLEAGAYDGVVWYWRTFVTPPATGMRAELRFERVNHACRVWLDGHDLGQHVGGYGPFQFDVSALVQDGTRHLVVLRVADPGDTPVDGMTLDVVPHAKESWYENFGGILGSVSLYAHREAEARISWVRPDPATGRVQVEVELLAPDDGRQRFVDVEARVRPLALGARLPQGDDRRPPPIVVGKRRVQVDGSGQTCELELSVPGALHWSPGQPYRYLLSVAARGESPDEAIDDERCFGFRQLLLDEHGLQIDGVRRVLKGVLYQPHDIGRHGMAPPAAELEAEVAAMRAAGFDLVRAHVRPAPPALLEAADRLGLLVLEEPAVGWVRDSPSLGRWLLDEVEWMVRRDHHHPSIVMWGVLNELSLDAYAYGRDLALHVAALDASRPVLEDSGGFFGSRFVPVGGSQLVEMLDEHAYPPCPIPLEERERLRSLSSPSGPVFVSEYGYGALMDTEAASRGFRQHDVRGAERNLFDAMRDRTLAALASGETWSDDGWLQEADDVHVGMTADMTELLRSDPQLDGLVYTQWKAVHTESSAGLLDPWGEPRPALAMLSRSLSPFLLAVHPARPAVAVGDSLRVDVAVINDTGAPVSGEVVLNVEGGIRAIDGAPGRGFGRQDFPPGVTLLSEEAFVLQRPGSASFRAYLADGQGGVMDLSREVHVPVVPPAPSERRLPPEDELPGPPIALVLPEHSPAATGFAQREGFPVQSLASVEEAVRIVLLEAPEDLGETLPPAEQLRLWRWVYEGGAAVLMLSELPYDHIGRIAGSPRGLRTLPFVPAPVAVGLAVGNFIGRSHVALEDTRSSTPGDEARLLFERSDSGGVEERVPAWATPRLLRSDEASLTPVAMLMGPMPPNSRSALITLNQYRERIGQVVCAVPFGEGQIVFVGLPLLAPVKGAVDPRRDRYLARLLESVAQEARRRTPGDVMRPLPIGDDDLARYAQGMQQLARVAAVADSYSFILAGLTSPEKLVGEAMARRNQGLAGLFSGGEFGREKFLGAFDGLWDERTERFIGREEQVLARLTAQILAGTPVERPVRRLMVQDWGQSILAWVRGDDVRAHALLDEAEALLTETEAAAAGAAADEGTASRATPPADGSGDPETLGDRIDGSGDR